MLLPSGLILAFSVVFITAPTNFVTCCCLWAPYGLARCPLLRQTFIYDPWIISGRLFMWPCGNLGMGGVCVSVCALTGGRDCMLANCICVLAVATLSRWGFHVISHVPSSPRLGLFRKTKAVCMIYWKSQITHFAIRSASRDE